MLQDIKVEVGDGIQLPVNIPGYELFKGIGDMLTDVQNSISNVLDVQAEIKKCIF